MRRLKTYKQIFESSKFETLKDVIEAIQNGKVEPEEIEKYIGIEGTTQIKSGPSKSSEIDKYKIEDTTINELEILINYDTLEKEMGLDSGILNWIDSMTGYNSYEYGIEQDELNYFNSYLNEEDVETIGKFARFLGVHEESEYENTDLYNIYMAGITEPGDEFMWSVDVLKSNGVITGIKKEICDKQPFDLDNNRSTYYGNRVRDDYENILTLEYDVVLKYMVENKCEDVETVLEFLEHVADDLPYTYDIQTETYEYESKDDENEVKRVLMKSISKYWENNKIKLENMPWAKIIKEDSLNLIKKLKDIIEWDKKVKKEYSSETLYLFELLEDDSKELRKWFSSDEFQDFIKSKYKNEEMESILDEMMAIELGDELGLF